MSLILVCVSPIYLPLVLLCWNAFVAQTSVQAQGLRPSRDTATPTLSLPALGAAAAPRQADYIVAIVNSEPVTNNEVRRQVERVMRQIAAQGAHPPPRAALLKNTLEHLIMEKVQVQLAKESGIAVDDYAVTQAEETVARQNQISVAQMHQLMQAEGMSRESFREELRNQLLALRVRERDVEARVRVSDLEIDQYLQEQHKQADPDNLVYSLAHILIHIPENATAAQEAERSARAQQVLNKLKAGADFADMAREYSDASESASGGLLGQRPASQWPELFVAAVSNAAAGSVVGPLRSGAGLHLLKVVQKNHGGVPDTVMQNHVRHILLRTGAGVSERAAAERLQELHERIQRGQATFAELARTHSQDGSAQGGGDLGWAAPGRYVPEFEEAVAALAPGQISPPVVSRFGVHLIELVERRQAKLSQREQRDLVRDVVREKKLDEAYATWIQEVRGRAWVEYRDPPQ